LKDDTSYTLDGIWASVRWIEADGRHEREMEKRVEKESTAVGRAGRDASMAPVPTRRTEHAMRSPNVSENSAVASRCSELENSRDLLCRWLCGMTAVDK
jgi:hypothetical protein